MKLTMLLSNCINIILFICIGIVGNILTKRFGYRLVAVTGSVLGAVFVALGAFSSQLWQLCLSSGVMAGKELSTKDINCPAKPVGSICLLVR